MTPVPATGFQTGLWFLSQAYPAAPMYSMPLVMRLRGPVDPDGIRAALLSLADRHELLRLRFALDEGGLGLVPATVLPEPSFVDLRDEPDPEWAWAELLRDQLARPVDLAAGPGYRSLIALLGEEEAAVALILHHTYGDARSVEILLEDFLAGYEAWERTGVVPAAQAAASYQEVASWMADEIDSSAREAGLAYWRRVLEGVEGFTPPADRPRPADRTFATRQIEQELPPGMLDRIDAACRDLQATPFMVFAAVFAVALARWSGDRSDPVLAVPCTLRLASWLDEVVAPLLNMVPLHLPVDFAGSFRDLVAATRSRSAEAMAHCGVPFEETARLIERSSDPSAPAVSSVAFQVSESVAQTAAAGRVAVEVASAAPIAGDMDLVWDVVSTPNGGQLWIQYATELFDDPTVERMASEFLALADALVAAPDLPLHRIEHRGNAEVASMWKYGTTDGDTFEIGDVGELFVRTAATQPDRPALVVGDKRWTYSELAASSERVRDRLLRAGVRPGDLVAVALPNRGDFITAMVGVLRAGAAYLPVDTGQPAERTRVVLEKTRPVAVLTDGSGAWPCEALSTPVIVLDDGQYDAGANYGPVAPVVPEALCYVMCTSGTTGEPKAVSVTHRGVSSLAHRPRFVPLGPGDVLLQLAPLYFDASTFEVWGALLNGATLVLPPHSHHTAAEIGRLVREHGVTVLHVTAGLLRVITDGDLDHFAGLRTFLTGGDVIPAAQVRTLMQAHPGLTVVACYGPTENTTFSTVAPLTRPPHGAIPIGAALPGRSVHLLDDWLRPISPGAVGEVYVGGIGLAHGYLRDPRQTAERFIPHPYPASPGERLYRTGDLARRAADGTLEFLGRRDAQVKIRGFRVEPAEVEAALLAHPGVLRCLVRARGDAGERTLAAYVVPSCPGYAQQAHGAAVSAADLRTHLGALLPAPLVPTEWVLLDELPLTAQGKVDLRALEALTLTEPDGAARTAEPARTSTEADVHEIWCDSLDRRPIGVTTSFFEVGGHSLVALRIAGRLERRFGRSVPLAEVLRRPTIAQLAAWLDTADPEPSSISSPRPAPGAKRRLPPALAPDDLALATDDELAAFVRITGAPDLLTEGDQR